MGDGWMDRYALQALLLSKVSKWFQSGFNHLFGGPVNPWIWDITFFLQRKRKRKTKEKERKRNGKGKEEERKGKGKGKEKDKSEERKKRKEKEPSKFRF